MRHPFFAGLLLAALLAAAPVARCGDGGGSSLPEFPKPAVSLHVAPDGNDANPGTKTAPFASLERARDEIRAMRRNGELPKGGVAVETGGGVYAVTQTFTLEAQDSGTPDAPVVYRAGDGKTPVFSGGKRLSGFAPVTDAAVLARISEEARGAAVQCDLKAFGYENPGPLVLGGVSSGNGFKTHPVIELFFDGEALPMARYPNEGMLHVGDICVQDGHSIHGMTGSKTGRFVYEGDRPARWKGEKDALLYGYWFFDWADSYERIAAIDTEKREITLAEPWHGYGYRKGARYYAVNLLAEMDAPGEWHLDRESGMLYLLPPSDPEKAVVELSLLPKTMVELSGVSHVRFERICWELGGADAVHVKDGEGCLFAGCAVRRCGGDGIVVQGGQNHGVLSCDIFSMGRGGVTLTGGDRKTLAPGGHFVENCHIHHLSRIDHTYTPAALINGVGNRASHNLMHHVNSSALRVNGNDHLVEYNEVCDVLLESDDQGGADMWGDPTYRGNVYRFNYWHHIGNWRRTGEELSCGQAGIRLDDAISGVLIHGNIFYKCAAGKLGFGGVQIHGGKDNLIENNIFADCAQAVSFSPWGEKRWKEFTGKALESPQIDPELYLRRYPELAQLNENVDVNTLRRNIIWKCGRFLHRDKGAAVCEGNIMDPPDDIFVSPSRGDFTVKPSASVVEKDGFAPLPFGETGLRRDAFRGEIPEKFIAESRARN